MIKKIINEPARLLTREKAEALAAELNAGNDGWEYRPNHDPKGTGYSFIEIFENNELIGRL